MPRLAFLLALVACTTPPRAPRAEPIARAPPRPVEPAVVELPHEPLYLDRGRRSPVTIQPDGALDSIDGPFLVHPDGRVEQRVPPQWSPFASIDRAGHVVFVNTDTTMDLTDDGVVRIVASYTSEIDMRDYLSRFPRNLWRVVELAFFLDVLYLAPARTK